MPANTGSTGNRSIAQRGIVNKNKPERVYKPSAWTPTLSALNFVPKWKKKKMPGARPK